MIRYILLLTLIHSALISTAQHTAKSFTIKRPNTNQDVNVGYLEHLPDDYNLTAQKYPLIIFLHGQGESGNGTNQLSRVETNGTPKQIKLNQFPKSFTVNGKTYKFIVISPQLNTSTYGVSNWNPSNNNKYLEEIFKYVKKHYRIDPSRIYLTGLSLGGEGVWNYAGFNSTIADSLAAIGAVSGSGENNPSKAGIIARSNLPVWAFHGNDDVDPNHHHNTTRNWVSQINSLTPNLANITIYPRVGHNAWDYAYNLSDNLNSTIEENMYVWFLKNQRVNLIENDNPPPIPIITANNQVPNHEGQYRYGSNLGYYKENFKDYDLAEMVKNIGGHTLRPSLPNRFLHEWGYDIRVNEFRDYRIKLDMNEITAFIGEPAESLRDKTIYGNPDSVGESQVFRNLYEPIWNQDGSINTNNYYADYIYKTVQTYGQYVKYWEVVNEPDFTTQYADLDAWLKRAPQAKELQNLKAPLYYYIRMLRISYEVIKKSYPDSYVCTGGIGYTQFLDALLRYTDEPNNGSVTANYPLTGGAYFDVLSFHYYPNYDLKVWNNSNNNFDFNFHSDAQANRVIKEKDAFRQVLIKYKYDGVTYPEKVFIMTETGVSKKSFDQGTFQYRYGSIETQRNFVIKMDILSQKNDIKQTYFYTLGDFGELNDNNKDEFSLMGFYENLTTAQASPTNVKKTQAGIAHTTASNILYNFYYDNNKTLNLNLPANVDGAAFTKGDETRYVLWAKTVNTEDENETATYTFPASLDLNKLIRYEWDFTTKVETSRTVSLTAAPSFFTSDTVLSIDPNNPNPDDAQSNKLSYIIFPNPSNKDVTIKVTGEEIGKAKYTIYNSLGKKIKDGDFNKTTNSIDHKLDVTNFVDGVYIINLKLDTLKSAVLKMIKSSLATQD